MNPNKLLQTLLSSRLGKSASRLELKPRIRAIGDKLPQLTAEELLSIKDTWGKIGRGKVDSDYWRFYKAFSGYVDPMIVPDNLFWSRIVRAMNPISLTRTYTNKSLYPILFKGLRQPEVIVNAINGVLYDENMRVMPKEKAIGKLACYDGDIIIKPTRASSGGSGVKRVAAKTPKDEILRILNAYGANYICQGAMLQSESTAVFNRESLNTFRVNTVNINGRVSCECLMMRHGQQGSVVDNFAKGGVAVGMDKHGNLNGRNFNSKLELVTSMAGGMKYAEASIPSIGKVIVAAIEAHQKYMPHIGHAAWDFALDSSENPVMIEVNLMLPGIIIEQLTSGGSVFGDRTEEVIEYALIKSDALSWTEFVGGW